MTQRLTIFTAVLISILALGALGATAALGANFTAASYPATLHGDSSAAGEGFITEGGGAMCEKSSQHGALSAASSTLTLTPSYSGQCLTFGFVNGSIKPEGCTYVYHLTGGSGDTYEASMDIVCPAGQSIKIAGGTCAIEIKPQTGLKAVTFTNNTASGDLSMDPLVTGLAYTVTRDDFGCPFAAKGNKIGSYGTTGAFTLDATPTIDIGP